jgi:hypothetical protein
MVPPVPSLGLDILLLLSSAHTGTCTHMALCAITEQPQLQPSMPLFHASGKQYTSLSTANGTYMAWHLCTQQRA